MSAKTFLASLALGLCMLSRVASAEPLPPKSGVWKPYPAVPGQTRAFNAYKVRFESGRHMFRYYYGQASSPQHDIDKYYDGVFAIVELLDKSTGANIRSGELVFFDGDVLPVADLNLGAGLALFYTRRDFDSVLKLLQTFGSGFIEVFEMYEGTGDVRSAYVVGQLRFDTPVSMGPTPK